ADAQRPEHADANRFRPGVRRLDRHFLGASVPRPSVRNALLARGQGSRAAAPVRSKETCDSSHGPANAQTSRVNGIKCPANGASSIAVCMVAATFAQLLDAAGRRRPRVAFIFGSGLGDLDERLCDVVAVPFLDVPGLAGTSVSGHKGCILLGDW